MCCKQCKFLHEQLSSLSTVAIQISACMWKWSTRQKHLTTIVKWDIRLRLVLWLLSKLKSLEACFHFCSCQSKISPKIKERKCWFLSCATILPISWKWIESLLQFSETLTAENLITLLAKRLGLSKRGLWLNKQLIVRSTQFSLLSPKYYHIM